MPRADLARHTGLNEGSVSRITSDLIAHNLLCVDGTEGSTGGRPGTRLRLDTHRVGIGVEIRRDEARIAAVTLSGKILHEFSVEIPLTPARALAVVVRGIERLRRTLKRQHVEGIGVSTGGIVNSQRGVVEFGNLPAWVEVAVQENLEAALAVPVQVDNNVRLAAIAEFQYGDLLDVKSSHSLLFVVVDEGIGTGIVLDGKLYSGPRHAAGEFGQMVIADRGGRGQLDRSGCLEKLASCSALLNRYSELRDRSKVALGNHMASRVKTLCQRATQGDNVACQALEETCGWLGLGLANMIWGLNPDAVVIDSPINEAWPLVISVLRNQFPSEKEIVSFRHLMVHPSSLAGNATIIGAGTLAFQQLFAFSDFAS